MGGKLVFVLLLCVCMVSVAEAQKKMKKPKKRIGAIVKDMEQNMTELWKEVKMLSQPVHVHIHGDGHVMQGHEGHEGHDHEHDMHDHFSHCHGKDHDHHQGHEGHGGHGHSGQDHEGHGHDSHGHDVHDHEGHDHEGHDHEGHEGHGHEGHDHKGHKHDRKDKDKDHKHGHKHHDHDEKDKKKKKGKKGHHHHDHMMGHDDPDHEGHEGHMHGEGHDDEDYEAFHHGEGGTHVHIHLHTALEQMMNNQFRDPAMQMAVKPNTTVVPKVYRYARCEVTGNSDLPFLERQDIRGTIFFRQMPEEPLDVKMDLQGFAIDHLLERSHSHLRGMHGHEYGDLTRGCTNMGGHFNPHGVHHGGPDDHTSRHPGDFGNLQIEEDGTVVTSFADNHGSLFGDDSLLGRGIVIHGGADDHGKGEDEGSRKSGNAGKRIACCAIVACPKPDTVWDD